MFNMQKQTTTTKPAKQQQQKTLQIYFSAAVICKDLMTQNHTSKTIR